MAQIKNIKLGSTTYDIIATNKYWANIENTTSAQYDKQPEVKSISIGNGSGSTAATKKVSLVYDNTLDILNFVFS